MIDWGGKVAAWFFGVGVFAITMALYLGSAAHPWRGWRHDLVDALFCLAAVCMVGCVLTGPAAIASLVRRKRQKKAERTPQAMAAGPGPAGPVHGDCEETLQANASTAEASITPLKKERPDISIAGSDGPVLSKRPHVKPVFQMPPQPVKWPVVVGRIPYRVSAFVERPIQVGTSSVLVLSGNGGVGKTELAAARFRACLVTADVALWVTASTRQAVLSAYQEAAVALQLDATNVDEAAARLLNWLASTDRTWIVVLDDVADPVHLRRLVPRGGPDPS